MYIVGSMERTLKSEDCLGMDDGFDSLSGGCESSLWFFIISGG